MAVPVELLGRVCVVMNVDCDLLPLFEAKQGAGELSVVRGDGDDAIGSEFNGRVGDGEGVVGCGLSEERKWREDAGASGPEKTSAR